MRAFLTIVVPLLLPTLLYLAYLFFVRPRVVGPQGQTAQESARIWVWLGVAGMVLAAITFFAVAELDGAPPGSRYEPAQLIDGKIQPGRFE